MDPFVNGFDNPFSFKINNANSFVGCGCGKYLVALVIEIPVQFYPVFAFFMPQSLSHRLPICPGYLPGCGAGPGGWPGLMPGGVPGVPVWVALGV
jgi:hypothetical protein